MTNRQFVQKRIGVPLDKDLDLGEDGSLVVRGYFTSDQKDEIGDVITRDATERAVPKYREWGNIRYMHLPRPVAKVVGIGEEDGLEWNEVEIKVLDKEAAEQVESGLLQALSVGIMIQFEDIEFMEDGGWQINDYSLAEISLVDHPANYDAKLFVDEDKAVSVGNSLRGQISEYGFSAVAKALGADTVLTREIPGEEAEELEIPAEDVEEVETEVIEEAEVEPTPEEELETEIEEEVEEPVEEEVEADAEEEAVEPVDSEDGEVSEPVEETEEETPEVAEEEEEVEPASEIEEEEIAEPVEEEEAEETPVEPVGEASEEVEAPAGEEEVEPVSDISDEETLEDSEVEAVAASVLAALLSEFRGAGLLPEVESAPIEEETETEEPTETEEEEVGEPVEETLDLSASVVADMREEIENLKAEIERLQSPAKRRGKINATDLPEEHADELEEAVEETNEEDSGPLGQALKRYKTKEDKTLVLKTRT